MYTYINIRVIYQGLTEKVVLGFGPSPLRVIRTKCYNNSNRLLLFNYIYLNYIMFDSCMIKYLLYT